MHWPYLFRVFNDMRRRLHRQRAFNAAFLQQTLDRLEKEHNGRFTPHLLTKITRFYCLLVPTVLCESYCRLAGRDMSDDERRRAVIISIMTPMYDDFFDDNILSLPQIKALTEDPSNYTGKTFNETVFRELYLWMIDNVPQPHLYRQASLQVFDAQVASLRQTNPTIPDEDLYRITYDKCHYAHLLYHVILDDQPTEALVDVIYLFSGVMQISNDAFDVYKDLSDGINTLPNRHRHMHLLKERFLEDNERCNRLLMALPYPPRRKKEFLITINYIMARGWVALQQLDKVIKRHGNAVDFKTLDRKELICDMEKPANILKWLLYTYRFSKRY